MRAMLLREPSRASSEPAALELADVPVPTYGERDVLVKVSVCGVCRTDLDLVDGRLVAPRYPVIPGHQVSAERHPILAILSDASPVSTNGQ